MDEFTKERIIEELKASTQNASGMFEISENTICNLMSMLTNAAPQLPQPAVVVDRKAIADRVHGQCIRIPGATFYNAAEIALDEVEAFRAAMLQGAEPVSQPYTLRDGWVAVPVEPTAEMISEGIAAHYERSQAQIHDRPAPGPMECAYRTMVKIAQRKEAE